MSSVRRYVNELTWSWSDRHTGQWRLRPARSSVVERTVVASASEG
jgi:hypothetical protein